jgi:elongation factor Ts
MATTITAALVQALRARTGAGMMDCKKALVANEGNLDAAAEAMRKSGQAQADKKSARIAADGLIIVKSNKDRSLILEINCETDFVSRDENFKGFAEVVAQLLLDNKIESLETLLTTSYSGTGQSVETVRQALVAKLGENIQIRRLQVFHADFGTLGSYVHSGRLGAIVQLQGGTTELAEDLSLHVVANNPLAISLESIPNDLIAKEREIFAEQARASGKPQAVIDKMVTGRLDKFINEVTLLGQPFVKDDTITVNDLLERSQAKVLGFVRFSVGEGIEKHKEDFAEAVMAQVKAS